MADSKRTTVKTRRVQPGTYATLDGSHRVIRQEDGKWTLLRGTQELKGGFKTSDEALSAIVEEFGGQLDTLNTAPEKPKANAAKGDAQGSNEPRPTRQRKEAKV